MNVEDRLNKLARLARADKDKRFNRLFRELTKPDFLTYAYEQIRQNKGSKTSGIDGMTKFTWTDEQTLLLTEKLRSGKYTPMPVRRILIDKKNKPGQKRPLGIPTFGDRVVQSALKLLLEALYEPIFMECSHGFRPHRACQTAMQQIIDSPRTRIDWVLEGDIKGCFDNICHQKLLKLLQKRIKDDRLLKLIAKFLKAGYFERDRWNPTKAGTPQGGIISPILANIYLHELDRFVEKEFYANQTSQETPMERASRTNPEYGRLTKKICYYRAQLGGRRKQQLPREELEREIQRMLKQRSEYQCMDKPIKPRVVYVRYADDFVILLRNLSKNEAERMKSHLTQWVKDELSLVLSPEKTRIAHITDGFTFLGYRVIVRKTEASQPKVKMVIPYESVQAKICVAKKICEELSKPETQVIRQLNDMLRGWMMYYRCVNAPSRSMSLLLSQVWFIYGGYVSRKHGCNIAKAAGKWIARCPASTLNPRGGQKSWFAETIDENGKRTRTYLVSSTIPRQSLQYVSEKIRNKSYLQSNYPNLIRQYMASRVQ